MKRHSSLLILSCIATSILLSFSSCTHTTLQPQEEFKIAIGYIRGQEPFSDEIRQIFNDYLPKKYTTNITFLQSSDIDFSRKDVFWHMGIGGTIFALKEIGEGIQFNPAMWEKQCNKKTQLISKNVIKNHDIDKFKKILIFHTDYPSPLALTPLYNLDERQLFESSNATKAIEALNNNQVDLIISETAILHTTSLNRSFDLLPVTDKKFHVKNIDDLTIPCRTLFFGPKASPEDQKTIVDLLESYPWKMRYRKILPLKTVDLAEFKKIQSAFDWKKDQEIRTKLRPL